MNGFGCKYVISPFPRGHALCCLTELQLKQQKYFMRLLMSDNINKA